MKANLVNTRTIYMKRNAIIAAGAALVLALLLNYSRAQDNAPAPAPTPANPAVAPVPGQPVAPGPGPRPMPLPPRARQPRMYVLRAQNDLKQVKMALQGSQEDYGGHKESAIAACEKALEELDAVMKAMPQPVPPAQRAGVPPGGQFQNNLTPLNPAGGNTPAPAPSAPPPKTPEP